MTRINRLLRRPVWRAHTFRVSPMARAEDGFTLPELLIVLVVIPILLGGLAMAVITLLQNTVSSDQHGTAVRLSNSHDAQITSAYFVRDVQSATSVSTAHSPVLCAPTGSPPDQLVGLQWTSGLSTVSVSYFIQQAPLEVVRYFCATGSIPTSTSVVSHDVFSAVPPGSVAFAPCPGAGFGANASVCAASGGTTYVAVVVDCTNNGAPAGNTCANPGLTAVLATPPSTTGITGVHLYVLDNTTTNFQYLLTGTPRVANGAQTGQPKPKALNPPFISNGPVSVGNCNLLANGVAAINDSTSPAMTIGPTGSWSGTGLVTTDPNSGTAVSGPAGSYPTPVNFGLPVKSPYDVLLEPPTAPPGNPYPVVTETTTNWDPSTDPTVLSGGLLKPAIYVVQHGLNLSKGLNATNGVLFYITGGSVNLGGNGNVLLSPLSPNWENPVPTGTPTPSEVVVWISRGDISPSNPPTVTLGGNGNATTINGAVYAPTAALTINGGGSSGGVNTQSLDIGSIAACNGGGSVPYNLTVGSPLSSGTSVQPASPTINNGQSDTATVTVLGVGSLSPTPGTVNIYECGPLAPGVGCTSTTNQVGGTINLTASGPGTAKATSVAFTPPTAGTYCFAAYYSGNSSYSASSDTSTDGCFTVSGPPAPVITVPSSSVSCYKTTSSSGCTAWPLAISGTASDAGGPGVASVNVAVEDPTGKWWNGTSYSSASPVPFSANDTSGTGSFSTWSAPYPLVNLPNSDKGTYTVVATITDKTLPTGVTGPVATQTFVWKG